MDSFKIHSRVIADYRGYIESFINIRDQEIRDVSGEGVILPQQTCSIPSVARAISSTSTPTTSRGISATAAVDLPTTERRESLNNSGTQVMPNYRLRAAVNVHF
jgi:hypothetical protein